MRRALLGLLAALALAACGADDTLEGSVSEFYPLAFRTVRARLYDSELAIEYVRKDGETVVRVTVRRAELDPSGPGTVDLTRHGDLTGSAGGVPLPPFSDGKLTLDAYRPRDGAAVGGSFEANVASGDAKLTVRGTFSARLEEVDP